MRWVIQRTIQNPVLLLILVAVVMLGGALSLRTIPVDILPDIDIPVVNIVTHLPGASPLDIERLISRPVENQIRSLLGVTRVGSTSIQGISQVTVQFSGDVTVRDARQLVQAQLARLTGQLPAQAVPRLESIGTTLQEVAGYVFYGAGDPVEFGNIIRHDVASGLLGADGVASVQVLGDERRAFFVDIDASTLVRTRLGVSSVAETLREANVSAASGFLERSNEEYLVRGDGRLQSLHDIRSLPIDVGSLHHPTLHDLAHVHEGRAPRHYEVRGNGVPGVAILVRKQPGANTVDVVRHVDDLLDELRSLLPPGTRIRKFYDQSEVIVSSRNEILEDMLLGGLLAILVLYVFLGSIRSTLIVAATMPLTLVASLWAMHLLGLSLNVVTMTALAIAVGMIVDDGIVVTENIHRFRGMRRDAVAASIEGSCEIAGPDASGTLTTVAAFVPFVVVSGMAAQIMRPFGWTISTALLVSLALSLTLVPTLMARGKRRETVRPRALGDPFLDALNRVLRSVLGVTTRHRWIIPALLIVSFGLASFLAMDVKSEFLPPIDEGAILVEYVMHPGVSLKESDRIGAELEAIALRHPAVECTFRRIGSPGVGYQIEGVNKGEMLLKLRPAALRDASAADVTKALREAFSQFEGLVLFIRQPTAEKIEESFSGVPALFGVSVFGPDLQTLTELSKKVEQVLVDDPDISNVVNNAGLKVPEIHVALDHQRLGVAGVPARGILDALDAWHLGLKATTIIREKEDVGVFVRIRGRSPLDLEHLKRMPIATSNGSWTPLQRVADVEVQRHVAEVTRLNGRRAVTLIAEIEGNIPAIVRRLRSSLDSVSLPKGYSIGIIGQYPVMLEMAIQGILAALAAVVLIYLIMVQQFGSWIQPFAVLMSIPVSLVSALGALSLSGQAIDASVGMGAVTLIGIAVNNAIVLVSLANRHVAAGETRRAALVSAASIRLRPILLTTLTTVGALLPAVVTPTADSRVLQPFAITVVGGMAGALVAGLLVVPSLVAIGRQRSTVQAG